MPELLAPCFDWEFSVYLSFEIGRTAKCDELAQSRRGTHNQFHPDWITYLPILSCLFPYARPLKARKGVKVIPSPRSLPAFLVTSSFLCLSSSQLH